MCDTLSKLQERSIGSKYDELFIIELIIDLATLQAIDLGKPLEAMEIALQVKLILQGFSHNNVMIVDIVYLDSKTDPKIKKKIFADRNF